MGGRGREGGGDVNYMVRSLKRIMYQLPGGGRGGEGGGGETE